jgi:hypothetical protein
MRAIIAAAKDAACADCGQRFPTCVMDFDHVRGRKKLKVSEAVQLAYGASVESLLEEIGEVRRRMRKLPPHSN